MGNKSLTFEDLDVGDVFTHIAGDMECIKLNYLKEIDKKMSDRLPNAMALHNGHYIVVSQKMPVKKLKSITDFRKKQNT